LVKSIKGITKLLGTGEKRMSVKHHLDIEETIVPQGNKVTKQVLISSDEGPNFAMRCFKIQPGGSMPNHTNLVEHEQYVLSGEATINIDGETYQVKAGDVVFIPANVPHWYKTKGDQPFEFLCLIPNLPDETTVLED
jgi:quercetin dioxygenase-like cupin family protein